MKNKIRWIAALFAVCLLFQLFSCAKAPTTASLRCTVSITCAGLVDNADLKTEKAEFVPTGGEVLPPTEIPFAAGETVYDVLRRACAENVCADNCIYCQDGGIQLEAAYTPAYGTYYIEGIHQLYEKDCGPASGWLFTVNGEMAATGCSETEVRDGDRIDWVYTTDWNGIG